MSTGSSNNPRSGPNSQDSADPLPQTTSSHGKSVIKFSAEDSKPSKNLKLTSKGVENAKKRLRAFSIQKKSSLSPVATSKPIAVGTGAGTVFIGKLAGAKTLPKPEPPDPNAEQKKLPKPPKPGAKQLQESYKAIQQKTLAEIEDMKRKMELVELGIPLGLICPEPNSDKAMPTKAMPPIKSFIDPAKVDEIIREAKKARAEGKEFKFDYQKLLPDYDNPFQRKKDEPFAETKQDEPIIRKSRDRDKVNIRRSDKYESRRKTSQKHFDRDRHREDRHKEEKQKDKPKERDDKLKEYERSKERDHTLRDSDVRPTEKHISISKVRDSRCKENDKSGVFKSKERDSKSKERDLKKEQDALKDENGADVNLEDFVVCDSWSDNEEKSKDSTPKPDEKQNTAKENTPFVTVIDPMEQLRESLGKKNTLTERPKYEKIKPVTDSLKFEIEDPHDDDVLDIFDANSSTDKFSKVTSRKEFESPDMKLFDTLDEDDTFLESVINEIKQEEMDETSQDKALVEYDESPSKDSLDDEMRGSVTPEMNDRARELYSTQDRIRELHSSRSDYSDSYKSVESGRSMESGYKSTDSLKLSETLRSDSEIDKHVGEMPKYTMDSLETWSIVLKICQPLLFRHDKNKCYKETRMVPKLWFTENPKLCNCVKDRRIVYKELEMCKMEHVDSLYNTNQIQEAAYPTARGWYPALDQCLAESNTLQLSSEWEAEDSQTEQLPRTPERVGDISLDQEYQRFMEAVWPEVAEPKSETPRSSPVRRAKKRADNEQEHSDKQKVKKIKLTSDGWSQDSDMDVEVSKKTFNALHDFLFEALHSNPNPEIGAKKAKVDKQKRKRKHSTSTSVTDSSESDAKRRKKMQKKKDSKKAKSKDAKRRRILKKNIKRLKYKHKKKKKIIKINTESELQELEKVKKKKEKKLKKKKQLKQKKKNQKKKKAKAKISPSSSSGSSSDSDTEEEKKSKKKKKSSEKKKRKSSSSDSHEELFDVNILNNIKTERVTDDEKSKQLEFSPRKQKPREIIDVKELQNDFVGNSIQIKKEIEEEDEEQKIVVEEKKEEDKEVTIQKQEDESQDSHSEHVVEKEQQEFKEQEKCQSTPQLLPDESNISQSSSQESIYSLKDQPLYEKDDSHLRPSSQNSNYCFPDVIASGMYSKNIDQVQDIHSQDMRSQDLQSQDLQSQDVHSQDVHSQDVHSQDLQCQDLQNQDTQSQDLQSQDKQSHDMLRHDMEKPDIPLHDIQRLDIQTHEMQKHDMQRHEMQKHDMQQHDMQRHVMQRHDMQRHDKEMHDKQRQDIQRQDMQRHDMLRHNVQRLDMQNHDVQRLDMQNHDIQRHDEQRREHEIELDEQENYEQGEYEMYEQMAMAYQSDVASQLTPLPEAVVSRRIETVVRARGEIKCDWRAGDSPAAPAHRPSRWGLKPGDVNIVLTGGNEQFPIRNILEPVYKIQSIANRTDNSATGYDEAYMDMYGASDKLQYGDCFSTNAKEETSGENRRAKQTVAKHITSLDDRINIALRATDEAKVDKQRATVTKQSSSLDDRISNLRNNVSVLGDVTKDEEEAEDKDGPEKGILVTKSLAVSEGRGVKRVSFADGYKPGQDSDVEEPPVKKKKKPRRSGCAWPCPATHPDHVPLWDALPPPPPPPGSPPPPPPPHPLPPHLLRQLRPMHHQLFPPMHHVKFDPNSMPAFMPPEPPPGLISFQNM